MKVFLDQQSLGLKKFLEAVGIEVVTDEVIRGSNDTSIGIDDKLLDEYLEANQNLVFVTKDKDYREKATSNPKIVFIDESEAVAVEALRRLAKLKQA